mgnify:CR=1 FL=1
MQSKQYTTVSEYAKLANATPQTVRNWIRANKITANKCGDQFRIQLAAEPLDDRSTLALLLQSPAKRNLANVTNTTRTK